MCTTARVRGTYDRDYEEVDWGLGRKCSSCALGRSMARSDGLIAEWARECSAAESKFTRWGRYPCAVERSPDPSVSQRLGPAETCQGTDVLLDMYTHGA